GDQAFNAATKAFAAWSRKPIADRITYVRAYKQQLENAKQEIAKLISLETGKTLWDSTGEVGAMIGKIELSIASYEERTGSDTNKTAFGSASLRHRAHGVMAVLGPFNFPGHLPNGHIIPALIAGSTIVFKPSELTPAVGEMLCQLWEKVGLPAGVMNLVQGARETGAAILDHPELKGVLFTGSAQTGAFIHKKFGGRPEIMLALEMGGNNPLVIWEATDIEAVANLAVQSAFITSGQRCTCARRIIVPAGKIGDEIIAAIAAQIDRLNIAPWNADPAPFAGALISEHAADIVLRDQESYLKAGAKAIRLAKRLGWSNAAISPGLLEMGEASVGDEETFGPLAQVYRANSFENALEIANDTRFGLAAGLISDNESLWDQFTETIHAGIVNFNRPTTGASSALPFGGPGISGNHRPGAWYAADYCAWPMASQTAALPVWIDVPGMSR
ncbi:MAG: succinylglutamate-semialdehyde dehydrogenase, partial [Robiginitomaculum sp.]|nr:succinylglutamate-semialdehyde dehydrogenase [Robiginitomaculum sp.]